jgi:hypothetical protein
MRWQYKVLWMSEFVELPSFFWRPVWTKRELLRTELEKAINRMAEDGWEFVDSHESLGDVYFIFRAAWTGDLYEKPETGIKKLDRE